MIVLGIETSCDDTGVAIYDSNKGLLTHVLASQIDIHQEFGGVVPELAARAHIGKVLPLIRRALSNADLERHDLDAIAYTAGPGLVGALLVGATVAKSLALALNIPTVGVHHMEAHLLSPMLTSEPPEYPFISLLVSGGHSMIVDVKSPGSYNILGQTRDDAVGEAFDKFAKVLGLPYPGGPSIERRAVEGDKTRFHFPRPMLNSDGFEFSFSGLKTHAATKAGEYALDDKTVADLAYAFQDAAVDTLVEKCRKALRYTGRTGLVVAGGVGANQTLRSRLSKAVEDLGGKTYFPSLDLCTDNGAMIAYTGTLRLHSQQDDGLKFAVFPRWPMDTLPSIETTEG